MRLFISINFDGDTKNRIIRVQDKLREMGRGNFTREENLHLTLAFLGEVPADRVDDVKHAMDNIAVHKMKLQFADTGCFARDSELWWIGITENKTLSGLQRALVREIKDRNLPVDSKKFRPHITLVREMHIGKIDSRMLLPEPFSTEADSISLMVSERINGKLTYTEIYKVGAR